MEDLSKNTTQQKNKVKLALLIVWIIICTAMVIYCLALNIRVINAYIEQMAELNDPEILEIHDQQYITQVRNNFARLITYNSFSLVFEILLYSSFMVILVPKLISAVRLSRIEHRENVPL